VSAQNPSSLKAAELCEKLAKQSIERGDTAKAVQQWADAAERYVEMQVFDKAISCLENAGLLATRAIDLLSIFEPEMVLDVLAQKGLREEIALARLHLQNRGEAVPYTLHTRTFADFVVTEDGVAYAPDEDCYTLAAEILEVGGNQKRGFQFLKGAVLAAVWAQDELRLQQTVDLALKHEAGLTLQAKATNDRILFLFLKIAISGEFGLVGELSKLAVPSERDRTPYSPFQLRLLAPIYLYRGVMLDALLDAMRAIPALVRYAERYRALFDGIKAGQADEVLERFVSTMTTEADRPNPQVPLNTWEDVERRFPDLLYAQPEYLAVFILQDQIWTTRAGIHELRAWIAEASGNPAASQRAEAKSHVERIISHALFGYLPSTLQAEVYQLGCKMAFLAEEWGQYNQWASILEEEYGVKDVLHRTVDTLKDNPSEESW
jgi:hypothetical protein